MEIILIKTFIFLDFLKGNQIIVIMKKTYLLY